MSLVVVNVRSVDKKGEKGDDGGQARGLKIWQLILSMRPARAEVLFLVQRANIPSKRVNLYITTHALNIVHVLAVQCA
jgi:hypothetical protein